MEQHKNIPLPDEKMDRRVRRTRKLLQGGLLDLMKEKPVSAISMRELCRAVDICRTTPYLHYRDVLDILEQMESSLLLDLEELLQAHPAGTAAQDPTPLLLALFASVKERQQLWDALLNYNGDPAFLRRLMDLGEAYVRQLLFHKFPAEPNNGYAAAFLLGALAALLRRWLLEGCRETPEALAALTPRLRA